MELNSYLLSASKKLLKTICELSKDVKLVDYYEHYDSRLAVSDDVDYTWCLISTALLQSENLWKNESVYKSISDLTIDNITNKIKDGILVMKGDTNVSTNCLLDQNNNVVNPFDIEDIRVSHLQNVKDVNEYNRLKNAKTEDLDLCDRAYKEFLTNILEGDTYGANAAILTDGVLDYRKLVVRVRHALAHSHYEVLDDKTIKLYHETSDNQYDFNVILTKEVVITILDELNETYHNKVTDFFKFWLKFQNRFIGVEETKLDDSVLLNTLKSLGILDEEKCEFVLKKVKEHPDYNDLAIVDKLHLIGEYILDVVKPVCSYGIIVNEFLYGNNNGIIDDEYYRKLDEYTYFNSEFFDVNMSSSKEEYQKHKLELLTFAYLNTILLNFVNLFSGYFIASLDLSEMKISEDFNSDINEYYIGFVQERNSRLTKANKLLTKTNKLLTSKIKLLSEQGSRDEPYFQVDLPHEIENLSVQKSNLLIEVTILSEAISNGRSISLFNYVLTHIRNCLAHGYLKLIGDFESNNISEMLLEFNDYDPLDKEKLTFRGTIKLTDLLKVLTDEKFIKNVLELKSSELNVKQR